MVSVLGFRSSMIERSALNRRVTGLSPVGSTIREKCLWLHTSFGAMKRVFESLLFDHFLKGDKMRINKKDWGWIMEWIGMALFFIGSLSGIILLGTQKDMDPQMFQWWMDKSTLVIFAGVSAVFIGAITIMTDKNSS